MASAATRKSRGSSPLPLRMAGPISSGPSSSASWPRWDPRRQPSAKRRRWFRSLVPSAGFDIASTFPKIWRRWPRQPGTSVVRTDPWGAALLPCIGARSGNPSRSEGPWPTSPASSGMLRRRASCCGSAGRVGFSTCCPIPAWPARASGGTCTCAGWCAALMRSTSGRGRAFPRLRSSSRSIRTWRALRATSDSPTDGT